LEWFNRGTSEVSLKGVEGALIHPKFLLVDLASILSAAWLKVKSCREAREGLEESLSLGEPCVTLCGNVSVH